MKVTKISYQIGCDVPGCKCLATYCLTFSNNSEKVHMCAECAKRLKTHLKECSYETIKERKSKV